jgi:hypothetical protein
MQKRILISIVSFFFLDLIVSVLPTKSCAAEKLDLKLRLKPGKKYDMRLITDLKRSKTIKGEQKNESFMFAKRMGFEVKEVDNNGVASIEVTFRTLQMKVIRAGGYSVEYDSSKQSIAEDYSKMPAIEAAGVGESFIIKLTAKGKIIGLKGLEQMHSRIIEKVNEWDEKYLIMEMVSCGKKEASSTSKADSPPVVRKWKEMSEKYKENWKEKRRHNIKSNYSEKEIKNMLSDMIMVFPDQSLAIGDAWTDKVRIWTKTQEINGTYRLKDSKKGTIVIDLSAKRTAEEEPFSRVNNEGRKVGFKLVGSCQGSLEINEKSGWLIRSKLHMRFTGSVSKEEEVITVEPME